MKSARSIVFSLCGEVCYVPFNVVCVLGCPMRRRQPRIFDGRRGRGLLFTFGSTAIQICDCCAIFRQEKTLRRYGACSSVFADWIAKSKMASAAIKKTTGLTGLVVAKNPHHSLTVLYNKILSALQKIPQNATYRQSTEAIINDRFQHVKTETDVKRLEEKIGGGQVEELIVQAENELFLARRMSQWKPWESLCQKPPPDQWKWPV